MTFRDSTPRMEVLKLWDSQVDEENTAPVERKNEQVGLYILHLPLSLHHMDD